MLKIKAVLYCLTLIIIGTSCTSKSVRSQGGQAILNEVDRPNLIPSAENYRYRFIFEIVEHEDTENEFILLSDTIQVNLDKLPFTIVNADLSDFYDTVNFKKVEIIDTVYHWCVQNVSYSARIANDVKIYTVMDVNYKMNPSCNECTAFTSALQIILTAPEGSYSEEKENPYNGSKTMLYGPGDRGHFKFSQIWTKMDDSIRFTDLSQSDQIRVTDFGINKLFNSDETITYHVIDQSFEPVP